jgi:uncharacterized protein (TIGR02145 family)
MKENLNIGSMLNGSVNQSNNSVIEKYCPNNDASLCEVYGGLYQWDECMQYTVAPGGQGICPSGWHIPTSAEWCVMTTFLDNTTDCYCSCWSGTDVGGKLKESGLDHWISPNTGATNESGFTALGAGYRNALGNLINFKENAHFWTSNEVLSPNAMRRNLTSGTATIGRYAVSKSFGKSIRCIKD